MRWVEECGYHCAGQSVPGHLCDPLVAPDHGPHDHAAMQRADDAHGGGHGGHAGMSMDAMVRDMRNRFLVALVFTIPIVVWSMVGTELLGSELATPFGHATATSGSSCSACRSSSTRRRSSSRARSRALRSTDARHDGAGRRRDRHRLAVLASPRPSSSRARSSTRPRPCSPPSSCSATGSRCAPAAAPTTPIRALLDLAPPKARRPARRRTGRGPDRRGRRSATCC